MKTLKKSIITAMLALGCFTTSQAQEDSQPAKGTHIKSAQIPNNIAQRKGIKEQGLKKNEIEALQVDGDGKKATVKNPNDNTGEPGQQVYLFSNGCSRTCTGDWYANSNGSVGCDGTAGPLVCINKPVTTTLTPSARISLINQVFDQDGNPTNKKGWDGSVKGGKTEAQRKGIQENGLKKNAADTDTAILEKKGLNAVNVKLSKETSTEAPNTIGDTKPTPQEHAVRTKGSGATTEPDVKPVKVEETKIGQPHP